MTENELRSLIRDVPDFPRKGIIFKDITPLLASPAGLDTTIEGMAGPFQNEKISKVVAIESRGFIFGGCIARQLGCGFVPVRKPGKLPWTRRSHQYALEYGTDTLEIHDDALASEDRVLIVDDVLATGGTAAATAALVGRSGATVSGFSMLIELAFLNGKERLGGARLHSLIRYD
jgi:adenine phosphoribosyltransferase